ncbi:S-layer homology domain-containing protein [Lysinibacillus telephonicus]|uniref:S-layer homology domain-containing protein n=1 Tax=Lysinibacillus telephonicus TaxID=1714840 RepID=A0A3S0I4F4_9BACI|nr:S-layer homology domain-containing protein [Lysinibacillus telephonicus]RTQ96280.1 S-layer homology domain-containing protein [Lysinibacillus telephonicus]
MKKSRIITGLLALLLVLAFPLQKADAALAFKDVGDAYSKVINEFVDLGIVGGYEDQTFRPNNNVTRGQAATMLARALKLDTNKVDAVEYKDIDKDYPSYKEIAAVTNAGIMSGNIGKFEPNKPLTRVQMATILANAFDLKGNGSASFKDVPKDHYGYEAIDALYANNITTGYENKTFKPSKPLTRAHFVVFLSRALDGGEQDSTESVTELLKEVYANEANLNTYDFEGSMNLGLLLPEVEDMTPEVQAIFEVLKDVQIDISGAYQKDPMQFEANIDLTLKGDVQATFSIPMVMTEEKMWIKLPDSPLLPLPEEVKGKFIEYDLAEMAEISGQPLESLDMEVQTKLGIDIINLFVDLLGKDFYKEIDLSTVTIPEGVDANKVIKFELTNESLKPFIEIVFNDMLPQLLELVDNPEYAKALGLTAEDIALAKESLASGEINIDEVVSEINKFLKINQLDELIVISQDNYISYDAGTVDITVTVEEEAFGFKLTYDQSKTNVNGNIKFTIGIPKGDNVIPFEQLLELEEEALAEDSL